MKQKYHNFLLRKPFPKFTKDEARHIKGWINGGGSTIPEYFGCNPQYLLDRWHSHGYAYFFRFYPEGACIRAGCQLWNNFSQLKKHYGPSWMKAKGKPVWGNFIGRIYQAEALKICREMQAFAKRFKIKMIDAEPRKIKKCPKPKTKTKHRKKGRKA